MDGYDLLATLMGEHPDFAIFRRFLTLNAKSLLYMQGELTYLHAELRVLASENRVSNDPERKDFDFSIETLMGPHVSKNGDEQWSKILEIREKLRAYSP